MGMKRLNKLPTPEEIIDMIPVPEHVRIKKDKKIEEIKSIFRGEDSRLILIIGPCSADNADSVLEYVEKLAKVQEKVKEKILMIPRIYTNKPRTTGEGYKGMAHQPDPEQAPDLQEGIKAIRGLQLKALSEFNMPAADEMLYPENYAYMADLLGYHAIGARSVENQQHRLAVSGIDEPVGMKNPTSGNIEIMMNSVIAAQQEHTFIYGGWEVKTSGNPYAHCILRGAVDTYGRNVPNYHFEDLIHLAKRYEKLSLSNPAAIIDCNHANSMKLYNEQPRIAKEILTSKLYNQTLNKLIKGIMIESYLVEGRQNIGENVYGKSITDACIGWDTTERLIYDLAEKL